MNGYTTINVNGKSIGLKFGMYSIRRFGEKSEKIMLYDGESLNEIGISVLLHSGYLNNCSVKETDPELTFEDFVDFTESRIIDPEIKKEITQAVECWAESRIVKTAIDKANDNAKKKTLAGKKLKKS